MESLVNPNVLQIIPVQARASRSKTSSANSSSKKSSNWPPTKTCCRSRKMSEKPSTTNCPRSIAIPIRTTTTCAGASPSYNGLQPEQVIVGAGSVEIIQMLIRTFLKPGEKVLTSEKTFSLYKIATTEIRRRGRLRRSARWTQNLCFDLEAIAAQHRRHNQDHLHHQSQQPDRDHRPRRGRSRLHRPRPRRQNHRSGQRLPGIRRRSRRLCHRPGRDRPQKKRDRPAHLFQGLRPGRPARRLRHGQTRDSSPSSTASSRRSTSPASASAPPWLRWKMTITRTGRCA